MSPEMTGSAATLDCDLDFADFHRERHPVGGTGLQAPGDCLAHIRHGLRFIPPLRHATYVPGRTGMAGHSATTIPVSSRSSVTSSFTLN